MFGNRTGAIKCHIPTNLASAQMAGFVVQPVESDKHGNISYKDLTAKVIFKKF